MRYTIWSHGRLVGETDLAWVRTDDCLRVGWFHPTADGEPLIAPDTSPALELRDETDRVVPTARIGIRDMDDVAALSHLLDDQADGISDDADVDDDDGDAFTDLEPDTLDDAPWIEAGSDAPFGKYRVQVVLAVPNAIP